MSLRPVIKLSGIRFGAKVLRPAALTMSGDTAV